jgi:hypothetical protein
MANPSLLNELTMKTISLFFLVCFLFCVSCFYDADLPLQNDPPVCLDSSKINASLFFPDSSLCTLHITDRNDRCFSLSIAPDGDSIMLSCPDSQNQPPWPGSYEFFTTGYETKLLHLFFPTNRMGIYNGILLLRDDAGAKLRIPFRIQKIFFEPFDTLPLCDRYWQTYKDDYSTHIKFDFTDKKIKFVFNKDSNTLSPCGTGIRSIFNISDSLKTAVGFKLREEMTDSFELGFFLSTSFDTGKWDGEKAGIFFSGSKGRLRLECRSINLQSYSYEINAISGELCISRIDSTIRYFFHDGNPAIVPKPIINYYFPAHAPVFIHLRMSVFTQIKECYCSLSNLTVSMGALNFK